jgi:hypothetical protein
MYLLRHLPAIIHPDPLDGPDMAHFSDLIDPSRQTRVMSISATEDAMAADPDEKFYIKMVEHDMAHLMCIKSISLLPTDAFRQRGLLRAILTAGHCSGPFDPVVNIVFNSILYKAGVLSLGHEIGAVDDDILDTYSMDRFCYSGKLLTSSLHISSKEPLERLQGQVVQYRKFLDQTSLPSEDIFHDATITYFRNLTPDGIYELCSILAKHEFFYGPDQHHQYIPLGSASLAHLERDLSLLPIGVFNELVENEPPVQLMALHQPLQLHFVCKQLENLLLEYSRSSNWVIFLTL